MRYFSIVFEVFILFVGLGFTRLSAQQYSYSAGSDFNMSGHIVHVSVGQPFVTYKESNPMMEEGILSVLLELYLSQQPLAQEPLTEPLLQLFPNPFKDQIKVQFERNLFSQIDAEVYDLQGILVSTFFISDPNQVLPLHGLQNGTYFIRFRGMGPKDIVRKITKIN